MYVDSYNVRFCSSRLCGWLLIDESLSHVIVHGLWLLLVYQGGEHLNNALYYKDVDFLPMLTLQL